LLCSRQVVDEFRHIFTTRILANINGIDTAGKFGSGPFFPLYLYPEPEDTKGKQRDLLDENEWEISEKGRVPNFDKGFVKVVCERVGMNFVSDGRGDLKKTFGPEDLFDYIYGIFHSPEYRQRYAEFLKIDFPRVPLPGDREIFIKVAQVGRELVGLHLMEAEVLEDDKRWPKFDVEGDMVVEKGYPKYDEGERRVYINEKQYFEGVRPEVWEFCVGGYQVCEKWLKNRRGRNLSYDDIEHYQKITVALGETIRVNL